MSAHRPRHRHSGWSLALLAVATTGAVALGTTKTTMLAPDPIELAIQAGWHGASGPGRAAPGQDATQRACTRHGDRPPDNEAVAIMAREWRSIVFPADGLVEGDWRRGAELARDGEPAGVPSPDLGKPLSPTGQCAACHQLEPRDAGVSSSAPSLIGYGARRGYDWQQSLLLYEQIYNSNAVVACSTMPRFGARKVLTPEQIRDIVAYLLAPQSPVNAGTGPHAHGRAAIPN